MSIDDLKHLVEAIRADGAASAAETRRHFDVVADRLDKRFDTLAETVVSLDQKVTRESDRLDQNLERGFSETQAMIRFSHAELDRRVRALEDGQRSLEQLVHDLQSRIERVESSTQ